MSDELDPGTQARLRSALLDLDRRAAAHVSGRTTAEPRTAGNPRAGRSSTRNSGLLNSGLRNSGARRLVPVLAGLAVLTVLVAVGWLVRPPQATAPVAPPASTVIPSPAPSTPPTTTRGPSQSSADAARDQVFPALAALPLSRRLAPVEPLYPQIATRVESPEGTWLISRPDLATVPSGRQACLVRGPGTPKYLACSEYSEILLLTPDLSRVLRAYPIPDLPPQWLVVTPDAVYCGRQGDGGIPDSMVCRIPRSLTEGAGAAGTGLVGRVFPFDGPDGGEPRTFKGWPGTWSNAAPTDLTGFDRAELAEGTLQIEGQDDTVTINLDPRTLRPAAGT